MDINPTILNRFFEGKYSRKDFLAIKAAFEKPEMEAEIKELLTRHWLSFNNKPLYEADINHVLDKIHRRIEQEKKPPKTVQFIRLFQRVAAILIVPLILSFVAMLWFRPAAVTPEIATAEIQCPLGVRTKFVLPDGTTGFLNSGSTLEYPVIFSHKRNVTLKGEAFFDVAHDEKHPFTVTTAHLSTRVLGTQFNVIAYGNETTEEIFLKEGRVDVYSNQGEKLETLLPDQKMLLNTINKRYSTKTVEAEQYVSWTEGKLMFRNENMAQVANRLGRWYNVEIEVQDTELLDYAFRATFIDEPLEEVLKLLALTAPIKYEEQIRETTNDDIYKKRKVIVSLDKKRLSAF